MPSKWATLSVYTVPSRAMAGATFNPGRCEPHGSVGGTEVGVGGHGSDAPLSLRLLNVPGQLVEFPGGALGTRVAKLTVTDVSSGATFTSQAFSTSFWFQGLPLVFNSITL